jgi:hypothetical protein
MTELASPREGGPPALGGADRREQQQSFAGSDRRRIRSPLSFRRIEFKYLVPERLVEEFVDRISPFTDLDPFLVSRSQTYYPVTSLYFDSFDLQSLFAKEAGWLARRRIRLRTYEYEFSPDAVAFLEIKRRHDFLVSKDRLPLSLGAMDLESSDRELLRMLLRQVRGSNQGVVGEARTLEAWYNLRPVALVGYERLAFVAKEDHNLRLTVDRHLQGMWNPPGVQGPMPYRRCGMHPLVPRTIAYGAHRPRGVDPLRANGYNTIEFKFTHAIPGWLHRVIIGMDLARSSYSKYGSVVRDMRPNLFETFEDQVG